MEYVKYVCMYESWHRNINSSEECVVVEKTLCDDTGKHWTSLIYRSSLISDRLETRAKKGLTATIDFVVIRADNIALNTSGNLTYLR